MATLQEPQPVSTIFIGGGTPTYLGGRELERLLDVVTHWLQKDDSASEFTVEANPGSLSAEKIDVLAGHGINRVSLGAQSFHPHLLRSLERDHQAADVAQSIDRLRPRIPQVSFDLIFGIPGESLSEWDQDLHRALSLKPDHISTYGLTYEKGTRLWKQRQRGEIHALGEESELAMYAHGLDLLEESGFKQYEISSHARPGCACRHNQVYWANEAYFGFGLGATRYINGRREANSRDLQTYLRRVLAGEPAAFQSETLAPEERARETLMLNLRRSEGVDRRRFFEQTGYDLHDLARSHDRSPSRFGTAVGGRGWDSAHPSRSLRRGYYHRVISPAAVIANLTIEAPLPNSRGPARIRWHENLPRSGDPCKEICRASE